jgi:hypothetical protein
MVHADHTKALWCSAKCCTFETHLLVFRYEEAFGQTAVEGVWFNDAVDCCCYTGLVRDE